MTWCRFSRSLLVLLAAWLWSATSWAEPLAARPYRNDLIREARVVWGLTAPIAVFAGQIEQESGWRPNVCSAFACGLTQFTPATAADISRRHGLGAPDTANPLWAIRALVFYDRDLYAQLSAKTDCDQWGLSLSAYNGGIGNVRNDMSLCRGPICRRDAWFNNVDLRSNRSAAAFRENRAYPRRILLERQFTYATWGPTVRCPS